MREKRLDPKRKKECAMRNMLLTSNGLSTPEISGLFREMTGSGRKNVKVLFIPTASRTEEELVYVRKTYEELLASGVMPEYLTVFDIDKCLEDRSCYDPYEFDCMVVCGGNTYYLLSKLKESGFLDLIREAVENGVLYVGVSAGSVIASVSIAHISFLDENDIGLEDYSALGFVGEQIVPHYETGFDAQLDPEGSFLCIRDFTALQVRGNIRATV